MDDVDDMVKPAGVRQAELLIWLTIGGSALVALINKWTGWISTSDLALYLAFCGLLCIIPYKISQGSNATRYVYAVLVAITVLLVLGGGLSHATRLDMTFSIISIPIEIYAVYRLFQPDASVWFMGAKDA